MILDNNNPRTQPSFSLSNRLMRLLWAVAYIFLFRFTPIFFHGWRNFILRCFGARVGKGVHVYPSVVIWAPWNLDIGDYSGIGPGVFIYSMAKIFIGSYVVISQRSHLCAGTHDYESENFQLYSRSINIGNYVWICTESFIGPGVSIGEGCVLGARGVATKNMPAWTVWAGNPVVFVKNRIIRF